MALAQIYQHKPLIMLMKDADTKSPKDIFATALHAVPKDVQKRITASPALRTSWRACTLLGRNEWICWITSAKKGETRAHRIKRMCTELLEGKRRPCCWPGCNHR